MISFLGSVLFHAPNTVLHRRIRGGLTLLLYAAGVLFLAQFFQVEEVRLASNDWTKEYLYLNALRDALTTRVIPWMWSEHFYHDTSKLFANPEIILTPSILLLRWISNSQFILIHLVIYYTLGFLSCVMIAAKLNFGFLAFALLWLLFNMNGFIIAHLGIGHLQWAGYYLIPAILFLFSRLHERVRKNSFRLKTTSIYISLILFVLFMNGSFHVAIWCMMFMLLSVLWDRFLFANVLYIMILSALLGTFRLLPAALFFPENPSFVSGYPSLPILLDALTCIRGRHYPALGGSFEQLKWWEYTIHIGFVALLLLAAGLIVAIKRRRAPLPTPLLAAAGMLFVLSLGDVYALIATSGLPFSALQRVSTRFISIPLLVFFITAIMGIDLMLKENHVWWKKAVLFGIPFILFELLTHTSHWRVDHLETLTKPAHKPALTLRTDPASDYRDSVYISWTVSKFTLLCLLVALGMRRNNSLRERARRPDRDTAAARASMDL
jgi:hypothetical protein